MWNIRRSKSGGHKVFLRLLVPNLLFLLLPLLVGWVIYNKTLQEMEKEVTEGNMSMLQQSRDILDRRLAELSSIAMQLVSDTRIMQFQHVTEPFQGSNVNRILDTRRSLSSYSLTNNFIFNYFIAYKNSELVLAENSTYKLPEFYNHFRYNQIDFDRWKQLLVGEYRQRSVLPAQTVTYNGTAYSLVTYIHSLGYPGYPQGAVVITVDNREIRKLLGGLNLSGEGWAYIIDDSGQIISSTASAEPVSRFDRSKLSGNQGSMLESIGGREMMITYTTSSYNGWTYLAAQPASIVLEKVLYIKKITFTMAFVFLALGLFIAYVLAYRISRPLGTIMETIVDRMDGEAYAGADAYRFIRESVARLIDNNHELQDKMKKQAPFLQAALFERLLKGDFMSAKDTPVLLQHVGIKAQGNAFAVAIIQLRGYDGGLDRTSLEELDVKRVKIKDIFRREFQGDVYWHDVAEDQIALLFAFASTEPQVRLKERLPFVCGLIQQQVGVAACVALGTMYEELLDVSRSYEEARLTLEYLIWNNKHDVMEFSELPKERSGYFYPSDLEVRLSNLAKAGEWEAVEIMLQELYHINFEERRLTVPMLQLFMNEMLGTIVKLTPQVQQDEWPGLERLKPFAAESASYDGLKKNYAALIELYRRLCQWVNEHKKSQNVELLESIVAQLHESFSDADLCLDSVADRLSISKGYLSQFFKEQTGVNFSDYLEDLRMTEAKKLLVATGLPVYEIAVRVGYSSSNTFCRAFKRLNGVSTTSYRSSHS